MKHWLWLGCLSLAIGVRGQAMRLVEIPASTEGLEIIEAVVAAPSPMNARELGAWQLLCAGMLDGNDDFVREDIFGFGAQAGVPPKALWSNDLLRLEWVAPVGGEAVIARLLESVLTRPTISDDRLAQIRSRISAPLADDWSPIFLGEKGDLTLPTEFVRRFAARALRPEAMVVVATPNALRAVKGRFGDWKPARVAPDLRVTRSSNFRGPERARTLALFGAPIRPTTGDAAKLLAMVALGAGKTGFLHQVARETYGWSYRQEALLLPEKDGWRPVLAFSGSAPLPPRPGIVKALEEAVKGLSSDDLDRVKVLAESSLQGRNPLSPFLLSLEGAFSATPVDRAAWMSLMALWGTESSTPEAILADCRRVTVSELKEALQGVLSQLME